MTRSLRSPRSTAVLAGRMLVLAAGALLFVGCASTSAGQAELPGGGLTAPSSNPASSQGVGTEPPTAESPTTQISSESPDLTEDDVTTSAPAPTTVITTAPAPDPVTATVTVIPTIVVKTTTQQAEPATTSAKPTKTTDPAPTTTVKPTKTTPAPQATTQDSQAGEMDLFEPNTGYGSLSFTSPSGNIGCDISADNSVRCDIMNYTYKVPSGMEACEFGNRGNAIMIEPGYNGYFPCVSDTVLSLDSPFLEYGGRASLGNIACQSREDGVTCIDTSSEHGFRISKGSYELF